MKLKIDYKLSIDVLKVVILILKKNTLESQPLRENPQKKLLNTVDHLQS